MNKETAKQLDSVLKYLANSNLNFEKLDDVFKTLNINYKYSAAVLSILQTKGYLNVQSFECDEPPLVGISDEGRAFIYSSSFSSDLRIVQSNERTRTINVTVAVASVIISAISIAVAIYSNLKSDKSDKIINELKKENQALRDSISKAAVKPKPSKLKP